MALGDKKPVVMEFDRGIPGGVATLGGDGKLSENQKPNYSIDKVTGLQDALNSKQNALKFDDAPTEFSANPVKSGGVYTALLTKQPTLTGTPGQLIGIGDDGAAKATVYPSNENLLRNWYFVGGGSQQGGGKFPINQRGETEYTGKGYMIDGWRQEAGDRPSFKAIVEEEGFRIDGTTSGRLWLSQVLENTLPNGIYTLSALIDDNTMITMTTSITDNSNDTINNSTVNGIIMNIRPNSVQFEIAGNSASRLFKAIKLELGPVQTLAHKEGDTWVLNGPPPNFQQELAKCQRYQVQLLDRVHTGQGYIGQFEATTSTNIYGLVPLPVALQNVNTASLPTIVTDLSPSNLYDVFGILSSGYKSEASITNVTVYSKTPTGVILKFTGSNFIPGNFYTVFVQNQKSHNFLIDANL